MPQPDIIVATENEPDDEPDIVVEAEIERKLVELLFTFEDEWTREALVQELQEAYGAGVLKSATGVWLRASSAVVAPGRYRFVKKAAVRLSVADFCELLAREEVEDHLVDIMRNLGRQLHLTASQASSGQAQPTPMQQLGSFESLGQSAVAGSSGALNASPPTMQTQSANAPGPFSAEQEESYHAALYAFVRRPEVYTSSGLDCPPHSVYHSSLAEWLSSKYIVRV